MFPPAARLPNPPGAAESPAGEGVAAGRVPRNRPEPSPPPEPREGHAPEPGARGRDPWPPLMDADLTLERLTPGHAPALFARVEQDRDFLRRWLPWVDETRGLADVLAYVRRCGRQYARDRSPNCAIWVGGEFAGVIGMHAVDWANASTSLGYWLAAGFRGRGLMTRACQLMLAHAFVDLELLRVEVRCAAGNARSRAIPERLGFKQEGVLRAAARLEGVFQDLVVYGLLAHEWVPEGPPPVQPAFGESSTEGPTAALAAHGPGAQAPAGPVRLDRPAGSNGRARPRAQRPPAARPVAGAERGQRRHGGASRGGRGRG